MAKLAQEISEEFLTCKICLENYKNPKCLNCLHTFCEQCIDNHVMSETSYKKYSDYREFTCPLCRKRTQLPIGGVKKLPDNFLVCNLTEVICRQRPSKFPFCDICKMGNHKHREANSKCLDCNKLLCKTCVELHRDTKVTKSHNLFDVEIEKDIECKEHTDEIVRFYCEPCETCICVLCTFNEHKEHDVSSFNDAVTKYKENIENLLRSCQDKISDFEGQLETLGNCETLISETEQRIHDLAIDYTNQIKNREKLMIEEISNVYGPELIQLIKHREEMQVNLEGLKSTCNLTELILKGKDIELLLLKKQVQEKLSTLSNLKVTALPGSVGKIIKFVPGQLDMGYIQDMDRPLLTGAMRPRPSIASVNDDYYYIPSGPEKVDCECQTDPEPPTPTDEKSTQAEVAETVTRSVETDAIETDEKGINTRSRSERIRSDNEVSGTAVNDAPNSPTPRRRRRRERRTDAPVAEESPAEDTSSRRTRRSRFLHRDSAEDGDTFYSADR